MEKMNPNDYILIQNWMVSELELKGNELLVFALIHGFCKDGEHRFTGSIDYIRKWTGLSKPTVIRVLKGLTDKELIEKREEHINNVRVCSYAIGGKILIPVVKKLNQGGGKETLPNNTNIIDKDNNKRKEYIKEKFDVYSDLSYVDADYLLMWKEWLNYKGKINKQYKTDAGARKQYQHWIKLSQGDIDRARAIVDQSIMREYQGLFDVKDYKPNIQNIDEIAKNEGFLYKGDDGRHYETMYDRNRRQNSYEEWQQIRNK